MCFTFMITLILSYCGITLWRRNGEWLEIWCTMIALCRRGVVRVQGRVEWSNCLLSDVPPDYKMIHCLGMY
ncbi:unnamed protein product [Arabidopsis halleri]